MGKIAYYMIILPISFLHLRVLYVLSDIFYILTVSLIGYRKKIIDINLKNSFPELTESELKTIRRKFYRHFSDLLVEGIKNLSMSENELKKRFRVLNPEIMNSMHANGKSVILVSGHYNNWEWLITSQAFLFNHRALGIGMPLSSKFLDKKINQRRQRFGMKVINSKNFKAEINNCSSPVAIMTLGDQSPSDSNKSYWMNFLNQPTAVLFGTEQMAHEFDFAVVFFEIKKVKRGYYEIELKLITENPKSMKWGEITEIHTGLLERLIRERPEFWLWSHKRWKRKVPKDIDVLRKNQQIKFNERFNYH